jgi:hypothetical protein
MRISRLEFLAKATAATLALVAGAAQADIVITSGPEPANLTDNVIFVAPCTNTITGPALLLQGCLNQQTNVLVDFQAQELLQVNQGTGGQASIVSSDQSGFDYLKIYLDPLATSAFELLAFNVDSTVTGDITINAVNTLGVTTTATFQLDASGQNKFFVEAFNGQLINYVEFYSNVSLASIEFSDVKQVRIGGVGGVTVPEPGSLALAGIALLGLVTVRRRKASK